MRLNKFVIATNNAHKVNEFKRILNELKIECLSLKEMNIECDVDETGSTFEQNALLKAKAVYDLCGVPTIADDSGLSVDALDGEPGVYSARYGGNGLDDRARTELLLSRMEGMSDRSAHFTSAIACVIDENTSFCVVGKVFGDIADQIKGTNGFGYDPVFIPKGFGLTFGQLEPEIKDSISHRASALKQFSRKIKEF